MKKKLFPHFNPKEHVVSSIKAMKGWPERVQILGFYKGIPIVHDPLYPVPDGVIYFINEDNETGA